MAGSAKEAAAGGKDRPLYEIVRDQLIEEIRSGAYPAGSLLPSVREITVKWTVSTTTARKVLAELVSAGYARSEGTRGHVSTGAVMSGSPSTTEAPPSAPARLTVRTPQVVPVEGVLQATTSAVDVRLESAPADVALALRLSNPRATVVVRRTLAVDAHGAPIQLRISYTLREVAEGTPLASADVIEIPWIEALAEHSGRRVKVAETFISARHPTDSEAAMLALTPAACILARTDVVADDQSKLIDLSITVWPGDTTHISVER